MSMITDFIKDNILKNQNIQSLCPMSNLLSIAPHTARSKLITERKVVVLENYRGLCKVHRMCRKDSRIQSIPTRVVLRIV